MVRLPQKNAEGIRQMHVCSSDLAPPSPFLERCIADLFEPEGCGKAKPVYTFTSVLILCIAPPICSVDHPGLEAQQGAMVLLVFVHL